MTTAFPAAAYRQLFADGYQRPVRPLDPSEDGDHYSSARNFFEWWYFDAQFEAGSHLTALLHSSLYNSADRKPTVDLRFTPPQGAPTTTVGRFDRGAITASRDHCHVRIGNCLAVDEGDHYLLQLCQGSLNAELLFWKELPGWKAGTGHLFADPATGQDFNWVVPLPRARVEGTVTIAGQRASVHGGGYHDHNWGSVYLPAAFSRWIWGRVMADEWTLVFGALAARGHSSLYVTPLMVAHRDEILLSTDRLSVQAEAAVREPLTGATYSRRLHLATEEAMSVDLTLTTRQVVQAVDFAAPRRALARNTRVRRMAETAFYVAQRAPLLSRLAAWALGRGSYLRLESDFSLAVARQSVAGSGRALYEVMVLAPSEPAFRAIRP